MSTGLFFCLTQSLLANKNTRKKVLPKQESTHSFFKRLYTHEELYTHRMALLQKHFAL
uniref:Uncharacterized protein n=1 Tax=Bartonella schoenbuchensis (strain DSM 13525 / NCTC 13165 / R1) TaxID=687861 RepID=E6Z1L5_BARSR|nr:hypothetical protein BARSC_190276 [Bartonella schoenbuchensis R1]